MEYRTLENIDSICIYEAFTQALSLIFQVVNGKILFQRGYWDKLSFLKQHNLPIE